MLRLLLVILEGPLRPPHADSFLFVMIGTWQRVHVANGIARVGRFSRDSIDGIRLRALGSGWRRRVDGPVFIFHRAYVCT